MFSDPRKLKDKNYFILALCDKPYCETYHLIYDEQSSVKRLLDGKRLSYVRLECISCGKDYIICHEHITQAIKAGRYIIQSALLGQKIDVALLGKILEKFLNGEYEFLRITDEEEKEFLLGLCSSCRSSISSGLPSGNLFSKCLKCGKEGIWVDSQLLCTCGFRFNLGKVISGK
ncbi:MAG: hypothetical protein V2G33_07905 [bacterium JZ-2024 1]